MLNSIHNHMKNHYHLYSFIANGLIAVSMAGLALVGILTQDMTVTWLIGWGVFFAMMFGLGKLIDQEVDDIDKVDEHESSLGLDKRKTERVCDCSISHNADSVNSGKR